MQSSGFQGFQSVDQHCCRAASEAIKQVRVWPGPVLILFLLTPELEKLGIAVQTFRSHLARGQLKAGGCPAASAQR